MTSPIFCAWGENSSGCFSKHLGCGRPGVPPIRFRCQLPEALVPYAASRSAAGPLTEEFQAHLYARMYSIWSRRRVNALNLSPQRGGRLRRPHLQQVIQRPSTTRLQNNNSTHKKERKQKHAQSIWTLCECSTVTTTGQRDTQTQRVSGRVRE